MEYFKRNELFNVTRVALNLADALY